MSVGRYLTFVFENRETVWFQIQEMVRAERIVDDSKIAEEVEVYNALLPRPGELAATLMIEIAEAEEIKPVLDRLLGIDTRDYVKMTVGPHVVVGEFEAGHSDEERGKLSAVHFVRFALPPEARERFATSEVALVVEHPNERARTVLSRRDEAEPRGTTWREGRAALALLALVVASAGCSDSGLSPLAERGRQVYLAHCVACHNTDPAQPGPLGPPIKGASRDAPRGEGAERILPARLHAEAADEGDGADPGGWRRTSRRSPSTCADAKTARRVSAGPSRRDVRPIRPKMILSATTKTAVSTKPAQSVPLTVLRSFLPALALSGVAAPTTALPSTMARTIRKTTSIAIFAGRAVGVKNAQWLAAPMKKSIGIDSRMFVREVTPPRAPRAAASGIA